MSSIDQPTWRSIEEKEGDVSVQPFVDREFQDGASVLDEGVSRRTFLKMMGASLALAGVSGCGMVRRPKQFIHPYAVAPEGVVPGESIHYATAMAIGHHVTGLLIESHEGRPTKVEGNPLHPHSGGAAGVWHQASVLGLYDPDRLQKPTFKKEVSTQALYLDWLSSRLTDAAGDEGASMLVVSEALASPTSHRLLAEFQSAFPKAMVVMADPFGADRQVGALRAMTGSSVVPMPRYESIDCLVSVGADFLGVSPDALRATRAFALRRQPEHVRGMNRLYVLESHYSLTGTKADHRFRLKPSDLERALVQLARELLARAGGSGLLQSVVGSLPVKKVLPQAVVSAMASDLLSPNRTSALVAGDEQSPFVHGLVYAINGLLGANGNTIDYYRFPSAEFATSDAIRLGESGLKAAVAAMASGVIKTAVLLGGNPVYATPGDMGFAQALSKVPHTVHLTHYHNETSAACGWVLPRSHYLESWGDAKALDNTVSIVQPLIEPMGLSVSDVSFLASLLSDATAFPSDLDAVKATFQGSGSAKDTVWRQWLRDGVVSKGTPTDVPVPTTFPFTPTPVSRSGLEVVFYPDYKVLDGRFSNNGWLQELPDPISKLTWDNAAYISSFTARTLGVKTGDMMALSAGGRHVDTVVMVQPGAADGCIALVGGYGRTVDGRVGQGRGFNVYPLRQTGRSFVSGATVSPLGRTYVLATTQQHGSMEERDLAKQVTVTEWDENPHFAHKKHAFPLTSSWKELAYDEGNQWGLAIDLSKCTGCNACLIACQSENNIPIVGKDQVANGREMHWIRLDRYFVGSVDEPEVRHQPMTCLQCENAPCEQVCPVSATVHSKEGLNDMVYNRCIGTKYCSNNCPVKVRRFNFLDYHQRNPQSVAKRRQHLFDYMREPDPSVQKQFNPEVTVRMRGVMEKCTYCVQRISKGRIRAKNESRALLDGEIKSACMQTCPADAIVFGDIRDPKSRVAHMKSNRRNYAILEELHLKARTTYLASISNPNPQLVKES